MQHTVSILICTRDRAADLRATLATFAELDVPVGVSAELLVIANGSRDQTAEVVKHFSDSCLRLKSRYLFVGTPGKSRALNVGIAASAGGVLMFTDDDVHVPPDWIERMCEPIFSGTADAVAGGIRLAPSLHRPWLTAAQRGWLASTEDLPKNIDHPMIGANMAIGRHVLQRVPGFDPEVGPGARGHAEDTLFWLQVREAGFRIATRLDIETVHHLEPERLSRKAFMRQARKRGEFAAYVEWHWEHFRRRWPRLAFLRAAWQLALLRVRHFPTWIAAPTMPAWELEPMEKYHARRCYLRESHRPANYEHHGLVRRDTCRLAGTARAEPPAAPPSLPASDRTAARIADPCARRPVHTRGVE